MATYRCCQHWLRLTELPLGIMRGLSFQKGDNSAAADHRRQVNYRNHGSALLLVWLRLYASGGKRLTHRSNVIFAADCLRVALIPALPE